MWFVFALVCTLCWGAGDLFYKKGNTTDEKYTHIRTVVSVGIVFGIYATILLFTSGVTFNPINFVIYLPVSLCYILSMTIGYFGLRYLELSISSPIQNSSGVVAAILCVVFLKQIPDLISIIGIVAVFIGIIYLGIIERKENISDNNNRDKKYISGFKALIFPILYCIIDSLGTFFDAYYLDDVSTSPLKGVTEDTIENVANISYLYTFTLVGIIGIVVLLLNREKLFVNNSGSRAIAATFETIGQGVYVFAMSGNGAVAAPMISSYCIVSLILSRIFLKEKLTAQKYFSIAVVVFGIVLMGISEGLAG